MPANLNVCGMDEPEGESFFYNARVLNTAPAIIQAVYVDNRGSPILDNPSRYRVAVHRFRLPTERLPLFVFRNSTTVPPAPPDLLPIVTLTWRPTGIDYSTEIQLISTSVLNPNDNAIRNTQQYLEMFNNAIAASYLALTTAHISPSTHHPFVTYDASTQLFTLWGQGSLQTPGAEIDLYVSSVPAKLFGSIGAAPSRFDYPAGPKSFLWNIRDQHGSNYEAVIPGPPFVGGQPGFKMVQDGSSLAQWNSVVGIAFQVFGLPVVSEVASSVGVGNAQSIQGADIVQFNLTDFEPTQAVSDDLPLQYYAQGPLRWYSCVSEMPVSAITIVATWTDDTGAIFPILLGTGDLMTLKLEFRSKLPNLT
jgi:hypothetical protein